jgi:serine-type D-Ala-D-Ala carboxypeptidase (penicillin-binding protein 5/6)
MSKRLLKIGLPVVIIIVGFLAWVIFKPIPNIMPPVVADKTLYEAQNVNINWPTNSSAIGVADYGVLEKSTDVSAKPTASIAKLMVALSVIKKQPLDIGSQGPAITIGSSDIGFYNQQIAQGGAVVAVNYGESISEYQALQAMLIASGNNMAYTLANWAFGSIEAYQTYAKQLAVELGLNSSVFLDPSGLSANTVSTPEDLVILGQQVLKQPVLAQIVGQQTAVIPVTGTIKTTNALLGKNGVIGLKTGHTDESGGCLAFAATRQVNNQAITINGVVLGDNGIGAVFDSAESLIDQTFGTFEAVNPVKEQQLEAEYSLPWGSTVSVVAKQGMTIVTLPSQAVTQKVSLNQINLITSSGSQVGNLTIYYGKKQQTVPLVISSSVNKPSFWWRLTNFYRI